MINERKLTERELESRESVLKGLLANKRNLVKKYGKDAEKVMYGIATKQAKSKVEGMNKSKIKELIQLALEGADYGSEASANTAEDNTEVGELNESLNPEVTKAVSRFIKAMAKRYDYSEQDAVFAIQAALKQRNFDGLDERVAKIDEILNEGVIKDMHTFLNDLRDSGVTNMFGAAPYLQDEFGLEKGEARQVLANWMQSFSENLDEMDMNDPVLMRMRASKPEPTRGGLDFDDVLNLRSDKKDLQDRISQLYRDMEQEAEPEGGPIADRYGDELEKLEAKLYRVSKQIADYDMNEGVNEGASKEDQLKVARAAFEKAEKDGDIRGQELALAAIDLINGDINEELSPEDHVQIAKAMLVKAEKDGDDDLKRRALADMESVKKYYNLKEDMDGGQVFDYFANKGYVVKERRPDGYPKKEGVEGFQVTDRKDSGRRGDNPQTVFFQYNPSTDQFTISQMSGYKIDQKDAIKAGMREQGMTWAVGIDSYITDGNYNPVNISAEGLKDIVDHVMGGLSREAKAQRDFYADRGPTSGTVDENTLGVEIPSITINKANAKITNSKTFAQFIIDTWNSITPKESESIDAIQSLKIAMDKLQQAAKVEDEPVAEKLTKKSSVGDHIDDFKDSDAKQFKGKSNDKKIQMAVASFLSKQGKSVKENMVADKDIEKEIKKLEDENPKGFEKEIKKLKVRQAALKLSK